MFDSFMTKEKKERGAFGELKKPQGFVLQPLKPFGNMFTQKNLTKR